MNKFELLMYDTEKVKAQSEMKYKILQMIEAKSIMQEKTEDIKIKIYENVIDKISGAYAYLSEDNLELWQILVDKEWQNN